MHHPVRKAVAGYVLLCSGTSRHISCHEHSAAALVADVLPHVTVQQKLRIACVRDSFQEDILRASAEFSVYLYRWNLCIISIGGIYRFHCRLVFVCQNVLDFFS